MAFSLDTRDIKALNSYDEALMHFKQAKPWRDSPANERPLEKRTKKHCKMILMDGEIRCRLHSTDVVRYTPEGVSVYVGYSSISTDNFIAALLRRAPVAVITNRSPATAWRHQPGHYFAYGTLIAGNLAVFDREWNLKNPAPAFRPVLDKRKALELRKSTKYADFVAWRAVYEKMAGADAVPDFGWRTRHDPSYRPNKFGVDDVIDMLRAGGDDWRDLAYGNTNSDILRCVYKAHPGVVEHEVVNAFTTFGEFDNYVKLDAKYSWAVK